VDRYFAIVARGIEQLTARELTAIGAQEVNPVAGGVHFQGSREVLYRALLTVRTASRILKPLREFAATNPDIVYSQVRRVVWEAYLTPQRTLAVSATADKPPRRDGGRSPRPRPGQPPARGRGGDRGRFSPGGRPGSGPGDNPDPMGGTKWLYNTMFAALKIKDAICDRLKSELGARPDVDKERPDLLVQAHFSKGRCTLSLDASGSSLHERGYREQSGGAAPLKETLAAAILQLTGWNGLVPLLDPMCGSGTLVIEAAQMALHIPAGGGRRSFACEKWPDFDGRLWARELTELRSRQIRKLPAPIFGSDASTYQLEAARDNAFRAHLDACGLVFNEINVEEVTPPVNEPGVIITNPPYGKRLGDVTPLMPFYSRLGEHFRRNFFGWQLFVLSGDERLSKSLGMLPEAEYPLWNGPIPCKLLKFDLAAPILLPPVVIELPPPESASPSPTGEHVSGTGIAEDASETSSPEVLTPEVLASEVPTPEVLTADDSPADDSISKISVAVSSDEKLSTPTVPTPPSMTAWSSPHVFDTNHVPGADELPFMESDLPGG
jgi:putative N6-adenine-specific DNA methylase